MYFENCRIKKSDGTCIYIRKGISHTNKIISVGRIKALFTQIKTKSEDIYITSLYRSHYIAIPNFIEDLRLHIENNQNLKNHIIVGDININILNVNKNSNEYINNYLNGGYRSFINAPTRVIANSSSCIDHIFGKLPENASISSMTCDLDITDHYATMLLVDTIINAQENKSKKNKKAKLHQIKRTSQCHRLDFNL